MESSLDLSKKKNSEIRHLLKSTIVDITYLIILTLNLIEISKWLIIYVYLVFMKLGT